MQRAKFEIDHQHARSGFRADNMTRDLQGIDRSIAAHEADESPLDRGRKAAALNDLEIESWCVEPRAGCDQEMGYRASLISQAQSVYCSFRQQRRKHLKCLHPLRGMWKISGAIEFMRGHARLTGRQY